MDEDKNNRFTYGEGELSIVNEDGSVERIGEIPPEQLKRIEEIKRKRGQTESK